jgi:hypothetical protein
MAGTPMALPVADSERHERTGPYSEAIQAKEDHHDHPPTPV